MKQSAFVNAAGSVEICESDCGSLTNGLSGYHVFRGIVEEIERKDKEDERGK